VKQRWQGNDIGEKEKRGKTMPDDEDETEYDIEFVDADVDDTLNELMSEIGKIRAVLSQMERRFEALEHWKMTVADLLIDRVDSSKAGLFVPWSVIERGLGEYLVQQIRAPVRRKTVVRRDP
jgi:hypothetical protein